MAVGRFPYRSLRGIEALFDLLRFTLKPGITDLDILKCVGGSQQRREMPLTNTSSNPYKITQDR